MSPDANAPQAWLLGLLRVLPLGVLFVDAQERIGAANPAFCAFWGLDAAPGMPAVQIYAQIAAQVGDSEAARRHFGMPASGLGGDTFELALLDGRTVSVRAGVSSGEPAGRLWLFEDVSPLRRAEAQIEQLATRDPLTQLYNRRRFGEELERVVADGQRRGVEIGLLLIDIDGFKAINDRFGRAAGDRVLVALALGAGAMTRRNEILFRSGGDEFAILVPDTSEEEMVGLARRIGAHIGEMPIEFDGHRTVLSASIGVALYPRHALNSDELIAQCDHAVDDAKRMGGNRWRVYGGMGGIG